MNAPLLVARTQAAIAEASKPPDERRLIPALGPATAPDPVSTYLASLTSEGSRRTMAKALRRLCALAGLHLADPRAFPWHELRRMHTLELRARLAAKYRKPASANLHLSALRGVLRECRRLGLMSAEDHAQAADIQDVKGASPDFGRVLDRDTFARLLVACEGEHAERDAAILALGYGAGLRRAEIAGLALADIDLAQLTIQVTGKGRKERVVFVHESVAENLATWLVVRWPRTGTSVFHGLSATAVWEVVKSRARMVDLDDVTTHDMRRSYITNALNGGADLFAVMRQVGHSNPATTARYDRRGDRAKRQVADICAITTTKETTP